MTIELLRLPVRHPKLQEICQHIFSVWVWVHQKDGFKPTYNAKCFSPYITYSHTHLEYQRNTLDVAWKNLVHLCKRADLDSYRGQIHLRSPSSMDQKTRRFPMLPAAAYLVDATLLSPEMGHLYYTMAMLVITRGYIPVNPIRSH